MILADKIIALRKKAGWSQEELGEKLGVTRQSVSKWEGAQSVPDMDKILQLSRLFGVTTDYLLKDELGEPEYTAEESSVPALHRVSMEEASEYLSLRRAAAPKMALATLLCVVCPVVLLVLARRHAMGYGRGSCNARVLAVFGSIYRLLVRRGLPPDTPSDAPEFAAFLQSCVPALEPQDAEALLALAQAAQFGAGTMTEQDTDKMRKLYQVIKHTGKRKQSQKSVEKQSQE